MADGRDTGSASDRLARLIEQLASQNLDEATARDLTTAIHQAIYPMCVNMLGSAEAAADAEQETWHRLLAHLHRRDAATAPILNGTAYVRQIARNVCHELGRRISDQRREVPVINHVGEVYAIHADHGRDDTTIASMRTPVDMRLSGTFGYRSRRVLDEMAGLSEQERMVLCLRQQGRSYAEIAETLGGGLSTATAQTQGERAMHHLRGRAHVTVWLQVPLTAWAMPRCPLLAQMKTEVWRRLSAGTVVTTTLYRDIGKHLDPNPNRGRGQRDDPACELCNAERRRSAVTYWWLIVTLPPLLALPQAPTPEPAAYQHHEPSTDPTADKRAGRRRSRHRPRPRSARIVAVVSAALAVVAVAVLAAAAFGVPPLANRDNADPALPPTSQGGTGRKSRPGVPNTCPTTATVTERVSGSWTLIAVKAAPDGIYTDKEFQTCTYLDAGADAATGKNVRIDLYPQIGVRVPNSRQKVIAMDGVDRAVIHHIEVLGIAAVGLMVEAGGRSMITTVCNFDGRGGGACDEAAALALTRHILGID